MREKVDVFVVPKRQCKQVLNVVKSAEETNIAKLFSRNWQIREFWFKTLVKDLSNQRLIHTRDSLLQQRTLT